MDLKVEITNIKKAIETDIKDSQNLDDVYLKYFSKKSGLITALIKKLPELSPEERREMGPAINKLQNEYKQKIDEARKDAVTKKVTDANIDLTLPLPPMSSGFLHPTTQVIREINDFFRYHGYSVYEGPEIETAEYNFRKLNLPKESSLFLLLLRQTLLQDKEAKLKVSILLLPKVHLPQLKI